MKTMRILLIVLALAAPASVRATAQDQEVVVRGETARAEIERILDADNLDTTRLSPREVLEIMTAIPRGGAPEDFWNAYQSHVQAWARLADAAERAQQDQQAESAFGSGMDDLAAAAAAIGTTFDEVERIARLYHARLPAPRIDTRTIA